MDVTASVVTAATAASVAVAVSAVPADATVIIAASTDASRRATAAAFGVAHPATLRQSTTNNPSTISLSGVLVASAIVAAILLGFLCATRRSSWIPRLAQSRLVPAAVRHAARQLAEALQADAAAQAAASRPGAPARPAAPQRLGAKAAARISARYVIPPRRAATAPATVNGATTNATMDAATDAAAAAVSRADGGDGDGAGAPQPAPVTDDWTCAVCLDDGDAAVSGVHAISPLSRLPCGHAFHSVCLRQWLSRGRRPTCPCCNADVAKLGAEESTKELPVPVSERGSGSRSGGGGGGEGGRRSRRERQTTHGSALAAAAATAAAATSAVEMPASPPRVALNTGSGQGSLHACAGGWCTCGGNRGGPASPAGSASEPSTSRVTGGQKGGQGRPAGVEGGAAAAPNSEAGRESDGGGGGGGGGGIRMVAEGSAVPPPAVAVVVAVGGAA
ncbi:hypothetical protein MMPV_000378 [Pyropia vietnamensis]